MEKLISQHYQNLHSKDAVLRYDSFQYIIKASNQSVDWAYEVWDDLVALTKTGDNHQRTIAVQVLSNLAKSDPEQRIIKDLETLMRVTKDEKFVTARHSLQCLWKIGIVNEKLMEEVLSKLSHRFQECIKEKNGTLIRYDIIVVIRKMFDVIKHEKLKEVSLLLIQEEESDKHRKKYSGVWKDILKDKKG